MTDPVQTDWNPETYSRFRGLRLRPAIDLMTQMGRPAPGAVVDLGCGNGAVAAALRARFAGRRMIGVDASPAMLEKARGYDALEQADAAQWTPSEPVGAIFSNALLHWLPDHATVMPRLAGLLPKGGILAVQMPRQQMAPSHALMRDIAVRMFPDRFDFSAWTPQVSDPAVYHGLLSRFGPVNLWETEYQQRLEPVETGHPVRYFTESTAMRPFADLLEPNELAEFVAAYEDDLHAAYPLAVDGSVLFPFRRLFFVLDVEAPDPG